MPDFASALYLGLRHGSRSLRPWGQLTSGMPAAVAAPAGARPVAARLAGLMGHERATVAPSTLHLFWDLFRLLAGAGTTILVDELSYPITRWGVERAAAFGARTGTFRHHDPKSLRTALWLNRGSAAPPVVVTDGFCTGCGRIAPTPQYLAVVRPLGGTLVIDDTQSVGILGAAPGSSAIPYGSGGGGSVRWHDLSGPDVVVGASLAKSFGAPLAVLAGSESIVDHFEAKSETRIHCSPPSIAVLRAAEHALDVNETHGDTLRLRLATLVQRFRRCLRELGLAASGWLFPVQRLMPLPGVDPSAVHRELAGLDVHTVVTQDEGGAMPRVTFVFRASHRPAEIDHAAKAVALAVARARLRPELRVVS